MPEYLEETEEQGRLLEEFQPDDARTPSSSNEIYTEKDDSDKSSVHHVTTILKQCLKSFATGIIPTIVPSFLHNMIFETKSSDPIVLRPTAYLDGMRGVAAFTVVVFHFTLDWYPSISTGYHWESENRWWAQYPFIRTMHSGGGMVAIFFVISGYVLTAKPLRQMRSLNLDAAFSTISSSVFRRALRLYLPIIPSSLIGLTLVRLNLFLQDPQRANVIPHIAPSLYLQLCDWAWKVWVLTDIYDANGAKGLLIFDYNSHVWTIPVEFRGSIVVFCTLIVVACCRSWLRLPIIFGTAYWNLCLRNWDLFLFLGGMSLAELHNILTFPSSNTTLAANYEAPGSSRIVTTCRWLRNKSLTIPGRIALGHCLIWVNAILAIFIIGVPNDMHYHTTTSLPQFGFETMISITPATYRFAGGREMQQFWCAIGAFMLTASVSFSPILRRPFESRFAQYLGFISYSIYLLHGFVLYTLGIWLLRRQMFKGNPMWVFGSYRFLNISEDVPGQITWEGVGEGYTFEYFKALTICLMLCIWAADIFTRVVDNQAVKLSGRLQRWAWGMR